MSTAPLHPKVIKKFHHDGSSKTYRGHSVICQLPADSPLTATLRSLRQTLSQHRHADLFKNEALLPDSGYHMTVFICIRDLERGENVMPREGYATDIKERSSLTGPYEEWLEYTIRQVQDVALKEHMRPPFAFSVEKELPQIKYSIGVRLQATPDTRPKLADLREQLAELTGITAPTSYVFHVTLAYLLREPTAEEANELKALIEGHLAAAPEIVELPTVSLCSFENMQGFTPQVIF